MENLTRVIQEIFAVDAGTEERSQIGSFAAGTPAYTTDPETMQALAKYKEGLFGTVIGENSPAIEDINSLYFLITRQLAYLFQKGVPEYHNATEYYINSIVCSGGEFYKSIVDNNIANPVSDVTKWQPTGSSAIKQKLQHSLLRKFVSTLVGTTSGSSVTGNIRSFAWSPSLKKYVAVGGPYSGGPTTTSSVRVSKDGNMWREITTADSKEWWDVCWSPELNKFVAVIDPNVANNIRTSPDGETWTSQTQATTGFFLRIIWCAGTINKFIAISSNGNATTSVITSPDGITWTPRTVSSSAPAFLDACYSPELGLIVLVGQDYLVTSPDGITWTSRTVPTGSLIYNKVCWSKRLGKFIAIGTDLTPADTKVLSSTDGVTWDSITLDQDNNFSSPSGIASVIWIEELDMFVANQAFETIYSVDGGTTWLRGGLGGQNRMFYNSDLKHLLFGDLTNTTDQTPIKISL